MMIVTDLVPLSAALPVSPNPLLQEKLKIKQISNLAQGSNKIKLKFHSNFKLDRPQPRVRFFECVFYLKDGRQSEESVRIGLGI